MTRMWMVDVEIMCRQHLLGEHLESHMIVGSLRKKRSITGYIRNNCIEPKSIFGRHVELSLEIQRRGYGHTSPLTDNIDISYLPSNEQSYMVDDDKSLKDLLDRCPQCAEMYKAKSALWDKISDGTEGVQ